MPSDSPDWPPPMDATPADIRAYCAKADIGQLQIRVARLERQLNDAKSDLLDAINQRLHDAVRSLNLGARPSEGEV